MNKLLVVVVLLVAGCATPFRAPPGADHIKLTVASSPAVDVDKIWLDRDAQGVFVTGYVHRRLGAEDTTQTHLDLTVFGRNDTVLQSAKLTFDPPQIPTSQRPHGVSVYRAHLRPDPADIRRIHVQADDHPHS